MKNERDSVAMNRATQTDWRVFKCHWTRMKEHRRHVLVCLCHPYDKGMEYVKR
jgi:hypothetical protein